MTKMLAALVLVSTSVAQADPFARYFNHGVQSYARNFTENCAIELNPGPTPLDQLASQLLLTPAQTKDFLIRLRRALDQTNAKGVVIVGSRRHRFFADDLLLELKVITPDDEPAFDNFNLRADVDLMRRDLLENSVFLKHFGARAFQQTSNVRVIASGLGLTHDQVPFAEDITALREQLGRDLVELEKVREQHAILSARNIFGKIATSGEAGTTFEDFTRIGLPSAFRRVFKTIKGGVEFSAGAESTVILKNRVQKGKAWVSSLRERGYRNIYSVNVHGTLQSTMPTMSEATKELTRSRRTPPPSAAAPAHH